jgi:hypothetical protein
MIVYIFNSNTSNSTIPQQQSAKDRMRHILMAVPEVEPVCCRCFGISYCTVLLALWTANCMKTVGG